MLAANPGEGSLALRASFACLFAFVLVSSVGCAKVVADENGECGDGEVDDGEQCDLGAANSDNAGCTSVCALAVCGDGLIHIGEEACDDGNDTETDDCTSVCALAVCGDGLIHIGEEQCDDGNDIETDDCNNLCVAAACDDGIANGEESDVDCGGGSCDACALGAACLASSDCAAPNVCNTENLCAAIRFSGSVTVSNASSGVLTDFQIPVDLTPGNFNYANGEADGSDLRFSSDGEAFDLPYWIETWNPSDASRVWVKVPSIPANGNVDIYLLYGNPVLADASNGDDTFEFFDDFEDSGYTDKWDVHGAPSILTQSSGELRLLGQSNWEYVSSKTTFVSPVQVFADVRQTVNGGMIIGDDNTDLRYTFRNNGVPSRTTTTWDDNVSTSNQIEDGSYPLVVYTQDADHRIEFAAQLFGNQIQMQYFCSTGDCNNGVKTFTQTPFSGMRFGISSYNSDIYMLLIFVTKYAGGNVSVVVN